MQAMAKHGVVGRGVLLDVYSWAMKQGKTYDPFTTHGISVSELKEVARSQKVEFEVGDILLIRSGYTAKYNELSRTNPTRLEEAGAEVPNLAGVEQTEEMKTFLHDHYFAVVGGDAPAFECWPPKSWYLVRLLRVTKETALTRCFLA
jgi:hypothetical protein